VVTTNLYPFVIDLYWMHVSDQHITAPGGSLDIVELQASDSAYQVAPEIDNIFSYVTRKKHSQIKRAWKDTVFAIKSDDRGLEEEQFVRLEQQCHAYCKSEVIPEIMMIYSSFCVKAYWTGDRRLHFEAELGQSPLEG
jgi:hypothetical protein